MITIDGSFGEGGGQILRTALGLSLVTGKPFRIEKIRAGRKKPGLLRQHLTAVNAAAEVGRAEVRGAALGSQELSFAPGEVRGGSYRWAIGTAGSATLVLQTVLPALLTAKEPSLLKLEGGTHNPFAPPFDFLQKAFLPLVCRMGPKVDVTLVRPGFYPAGGGCFKVEIQPAAQLSRIDIPERGEIKRRLARALVANLPLHIAMRELAVIGRKLNWPDACLKAEPVEGSAGPGNIVVIEVESEHLTEVFTGFGEKGRPAETVADEAVKEARSYIADSAAVGEHLADQLLVPMALAGGGRFRTVAPSRHTSTNAEIIGRFLDVAVKIEKESSSAWRVEVAGK
ncbi:MAG TPA: RNA 3'-terminal phosphate cyclase [Planctomycetota bacterium]|nr:RNA 3'-terminal phosphate cyclase [Planctomycetota bacterium]